MSHAPWWDAESIRDSLLMARYENADGFLPDGLPASIARSWDFHRRCLVPEEELIPVGSGKPAMYKHIMSVYSRFARGEPIPASYGLDLYCYRTSGEVEHVELLRCSMSPDRLVLGM